MSAEAFAALVEARRTGAGKWQGRCPAHQDRSPSLSIREGQDGRVLLHCFAGCTHTAIVAAMGLSTRDLNAGPSPSPAEQRREAWDSVRKWRAAVDALGAKLARTPEDDALAKVFNDAYDRLHQAETEAEKVVGQKMLSLGNGPGYGPLSGWIMFLKFPLSQNVPLKP